MSKLTGKARARESAKSIRTARNRKLLRDSQLRKQIRKWDDPILKVICTPVEINEFETASQTVDLMIRILKATKDGLGLAAPQVGVDKQIIVFRESLNSNEFNVMVNPLIEDQSLISVQSREGCLSFPGYETIVSRHAQVKVRWKTLDFQDQSEWLEKTRSVVFQHENDHLQGICPVRDTWEKAVGRTPKDIEEVVIPENIKQELQAIT